MWRQYLVDGAAADLPSGTGVGYGDEIMATAAARALKRADTAAAVVIGDGVSEVWNEETAAVFAGNPYVTRLADVGPGTRIAWLKNYRGRRPYLDYERCEPGRRQVFLPYRAEVGELYFADDERVAAAALVRDVRRTGLPVLSLEPHVAFGPTKDWGIDRWQLLAEALRDDVVMLQPSYGLPILRGVIAVPTKFRGFAAVLEHVDAHVGPEGALHHAAAAVGCPAVVVFGGRVAPAMTGYDTHENLYVDGPGSPCGMIAACDHCAACFAAIDVPAVQGAVRRQLAAGALRLAAQPRRSSACSAATTRAVDWG